LILDTHPAIPNAASVQTTIDMVAAVLERRGAVVRRQVAQVPDLEAGTRLYLRLLLSAIAANYPPEIYETLREQALQLSPADRSLAAERLRGSVLSHRDWVAADTQRAQLRGQWQSVFSDHDVVLCPVSPTPAFRHDFSPNQWMRKIDIDGQEYDYADQLVWSGIATAPGLPATVMPVSRDALGLPIGVQLIGPMYEDRTTLHLAALLEQEFGGFVAPFA
jgi:amidase